MSQSSGQLLDDEFCNSKTRPIKERICIDNPECVHEVPQSSHVEHKVDKSAKSFWSKGNWGQVRFIGIKMHLQISVNLVEIYGPSFSYVLLFHTSVLKNVWGRY